MNNKQSRIFYYPLALISVLLGLTVFYTSYLQGQEQVLATTDSNKTAKANLFIEGLLVTESSTGLILVTGTVYINSTMNMEDVKVIVELFDTNNMLIRETERFVTPPSTVFESENREGFNFLINADQVDHHNVTAYGIPR